MCTDVHSPSSLGSNFQNGGMLQNVWNFCQGRKACCCKPFTLKGLQRRQKDWLLANTSPWSILNLALSRAKASLFTVQGSLHSTQPPVLTNISSPCDRALWPAQMEGGSHQVVGTSACLHSVSLPSWSDRKGTVTALAGGHYPLTTNCAQATLKNSDQGHALRASCYSFHVFPLEGDVIFHSSKGSSWGWLQKPETVTRSPCLLSTKSALSNWTARCMVPNHSA